MSVLRVKSLIGFSQGLYWFDGNQISPRISRIGYCALLHRHHEYVVQEIGADEPQRERFLRLSTYD